jgi:hypothetical protein
MSNRVSAEPVSVSWETGISAQRQTRKTRLKAKFAVAETKRRKEGPPIAGLCRLFGKSPLDRECVVGLRGLELRAKHAVAIEPMSRE